MLKMLPFDNKSEFEAVLDMPVGTPLEETARVLRSQYTATSMIGMSALAGIIVSNSILLVDFIRQQIAEGIDLRIAMIQSAAVRAKPIALTGLEAMLGALFILDDPIFDGLAISLPSASSFPRCTRLS